MNRVPSLREVIGSHIDVALDGLRVAMPGRIDAYDPATRRAAVQPLLMVPVHKVDGTVESVAIRKLVEVPVLSLQGGGRGIKVPIAPGDACLLLFADFSVDEWKAKGGVVDPKGFGQHAVADAFAIVGLADPAAPAPAASIEVLPDGKVLLGEGATQAVPLGDNLVHALAYGLDQTQIASVGPLAPLKVPLSNLVTALGYTPGSVSIPVGTPAVLSSSVKTA